MHNIFFSYLTSLHLAIYMYKIFFLLDILLVHHFLMVLVFDMVIVYLICFFLVFVPLVLYGGTNNPAWVVLSFYIDAFMLPCYGGR